MEMPADILIERLGKLRDNGDPDFDHTAAALDIDTELQEKFLFFPFAELDEAREQIEESRDTLYLGQGIGYVGVGKDADPDDLLTLAVNAAAMYTHLKDRQEKLARRPEPGVYQGSHHGTSWFTVVVTEDRRVLIPQTEGGMIDTTDRWDNGMTLQLRRIDTVTGQVAE